MANISRRQFMGSVPAGTSLALLSRNSNPQKFQQKTISHFYRKEPAAAPARSLDLTPARWIWYPLERTLQNTFVLFQKFLDLQEIPSRARGWILGDSRYLFFIN